MASPAQHLGPPPVVVADDGAALELRLSGEVDLVHAPELDAVAAALEPSPGRPVLVDLTAATFVDSTVIAWLMTVAHRVESASAQLVVIVGQGAVRRALEISGVTAYLTVAEDPFLPPVHLPAGAPQA